MIFRSVGYTPGILKIAGSIMITVRYKTFVDLGLSNSGISIPPVLP